MKSRGYRIFCSACAGLVTLLSARAYATVTFTTNALIAGADVTYEGTNIVVDGAILTVEGNHVFGGLAATNGGTVAYAGSMLTLDSLTLHNSVFQQVGGSTLQVSNAVDIAGSSTYVMQGSNPTAQVGGVWAGEGGRLEASSLTIDAAATLHADGQGYTGGYRAVGNGPGGGGKAYGGSGGGHGGVGGRGNGQAPGGVSYDDPLAPTMPGSGGAGGDGGSAAGGNGGGAIRVMVGGLLQLDGRISADGANAASSYSAGGAGGSVWVDAGSLSGAGILRADGGNGGYRGGGGGGGRVVVECGDRSGFSNAAGASADGGTHGGSAYPGTAGTVAFLDPTGADPVLSVYQQLGLPTGSNAFAAVHVLDGGAFTLATNAEFHVAGGVVVGAASTWTIGGGSEVVVGGTLHVSNGAQVVVQTVDGNGMVGGSWQGRGVVLRAANVTLETGAALHGGEQGYRGGTTAAGAGPGGGGSACGGSGAGHGGMGGYGNGQAPRGEPYGSARRPMHPGSGGGGGTCSAGRGGHGGGALRLIVDGQLQLDGTIRMDAGNATAGYSGGGAGGAVWIDTHDLTGAGRIEADGGNGGYRGGGGGGGRIAVYYSGSNEWPTVNVSAAGGTHGGQAYAGLAGTVVTGPKAGNWWHRADFVATMLVSNDHAGLELDCPAPGWSTRIERTWDLLNTNWQVICVTTSDVADCRWSEPLTNGVTSVFFRAFSSPVR